MKKQLIAVATASIVLIGPASAQEDEIIVTGSRISSYGRDFVPVIHLKRRADFMVQEVIVESDTRDLKLRKDEVVKTLQALADSADRDKQIELGLVRTFQLDDDEVQFVEPFTRASIKNEILSSGIRSDTTRATIVAKTPISATDTHDSAFRRLKSFIENASVTGRATVSDGDDPGLSIVDLAQYRAPLLKMLAADSADVRAVFGENYHVSITGLEQPVRWRVTGPLELAIYFSYSSAASAD